MVLGFFDGLGNFDVEIVVTIECKYELVTLYELSGVNELNDDEYLKLDACCDRAVNPNVVTDSPGKDCKCTDVSIFEEIEADDVDILNVEECLKSNVDVDLNIDTNNEDDFFKVEVTFLVDILTVVEV